MIELRDPNQSIRRPHDGPRRESLNLTNVLIVQGPEFSTRSEASLVLTRHRSLRRRPAPMPPHELRWYACCSDVCCARLSTKGNPERQRRTERRAHIRGGLHSRSASYTAAAAPRMQETSGLVRTELNGMRNLRLVSSRERRLSADRRRFARGDGRRAIDRVMITPATPSCDGCGSLTGPYWVSGTGRFDEYRCIECGTSLFVARS